MADEQKQVVEWKYSRTQNLEELFSQNCYGVIELIDGQKVKTQFTFRNGMTAERAGTQFAEFRAFLEIAASNGVKFEQPQGDLPVAQTTVPSITGAPDGNEPVTATNIQLPPGTAMYTIAAVFRDQDKNKTKDILKVVTVEQPYNTKYGVSCFHPGPEFDGWKTWPIGTRGNAPKGAGHVIIRAPQEGGKYADVIEFRP